MRESEIKSIIEALLFASPEPLTQAKANGIFSPTSPNLKKVIEELMLLQPNQVHHGHLVVFLILATTELI